MDFASNKTKRRANNPGMGMERGGGGGGPHGGPGRHPPPDPRIQELPLRYRQSISVARIRSHF